MMEGIVVGKDGDKKGGEPKDPEKPSEAETLIRTTDMRKNDATRSINGPKRGLAKRHVRMELFSEAKTRWSLEHNQLSCQHDKDSVLLFRACCSHLGPHALATGSFGGSPCYEKDRTRMMWFDTSFLVAMKKSAWGTKPGREVVLAIWVRRKFIADCLAKAVCSDTFGSTPPRASAAIASARGARPRRSNSGATIRSREGSDSGSVSGSATGYGTSSRGGSRGTAPPSLHEEHHGSSGAVSTALQTSNGDRARVSEGDGAGNRNGSTRSGGAATGVHGQGIWGGQAGEAEVGAASRGDGGSVAAVRNVGHGGHGVELGSPPDDGDDVGSDGRRRAKARLQASAVRNGSLDDSANDGDRRVKDAVRLHWEPERQPSGEKHRTRRVAQLGLKGEWLRRLGSGEAIVKIERLDALVDEQRAVLESKEPQLLRVPVATPLDCGHLEERQLKALHLVDEKARPKLRILCLHGYLQNSEVFSQRTRQLSRKLRQTAELVYVDAPHLLAPEELPPPITPPLPSPLAQAAEAAAAAAAKAAAKIVSRGEGGAPGALDERQENLEQSPSDGSEAGEGARNYPGGSAGGVGGGMAAPDQAVEPRVHGEVGSEGSEGSGGGTVMETVRKERDGARAWWKCDPEARRKAKAVPGMKGRCEWKGLEESLVFLSRIWDERGPFDGLLGFSQGAAMASVFHQCMFGSISGSRLGSQVDKVNCAGSTGGGTAKTEPLLSVPVPSSPAPRFAVFVSGSYHPHPTQVPSYPLSQDQPQEDLPSLHIWALEDPFVPAAQSKRLAATYLRACVLMHRGSHFVPQSKEIVPHFIRFLEELR